MAVVEGRLFGESSPLWASAFVRREVCECCSALVEPFVLFTLGVSLSRAQQSRALAGGIEAAREALRDRSHAETHAKATTAKARVLFALIPAESNQS